MYKLRPTDVTTFQSFSECCLVLLSIAGVLYQAMPECCQPVPSAAGTLPSIASAHPITARVLPVSAQVLQSTASVFLSTAGPGEIPSTIRVLLSIARVLPITDILLCINATCLITYVLTDRVGLACPT